MIKTHGEYDGVLYKQIKYCIMNLAYEYLMYYGDSCETVYINSMKEIKDSIRNINARGVLNDAR